MHSVVRLLSHLVEVYVCKKEFPEVKIFNKKKDFGFKKMLPSLIFHKICGLVSSNVDTIIISSFLAFVVCLTSEGAAAVYTWAFQALASGRPRTLPPCLKVFSFLLVLIHGPSLSSGSLTEAWAPSAWFS